MSEDPETEMIQRAVFGKQVEAFLNSEIGKYMVSRAHDQRSAAEAEFLTVDCSNAEQVRAIQNRAIIADSVVGWLQDAVQDGVQALGIIEDRR